LQDGGCTFAFSRSGAFFLHNIRALPNTLLITGASQLLTLRGRGPRRGAALSKLGIIKDGSLLVRDGRIAAIGSRTKIAALPDASAAEKLDVGGRVVLPDLWIPTPTWFTLPAAPKNTS